MRKKESYERARNKRHDWTELNECRERATRSSPGVLCDLKEAVKTLKVRTTQYQIWECRRRGPERGEIKPCEQGRGGENELETELEDVLRSNFLSELHENVVVSLLSV